MAANGKTNPDRTKKGAGNYDWGSPSAGLPGGGAGCHWNSVAHTIDQYTTDNQLMLVSNSDCECNYDLQGNGWEDWVNQWIAHGRAKSAVSWEGWFAGGSKKAPAWAVDVAACWVSNPRDMVSIQNMIWFKRFDWSNQLIPKSSWDVKNPATDRYYWGWNEVPVESLVVNNPKNWDAIVIKLPSAICGGSGGSDSISCLTPAARVDLETQLAWHEKHLFLKPGEKSIVARPGSYVVLLREWQQSENHWQRWFFCESWNSNKYQVVYKAPSGKFVGECYVDRGTGPAPAPPPVPACTGTVGRFLVNRDQSLCLDVAGGNVINGATMQVWACNGMPQQNFIWCSDGRIVSAKDKRYCVDVPGGDPTQATDLQIWECNSRAGQYWKYDSNTMAVFPASVGEKMCMDIEHGSAQAGTKVNTFACTPGTGEKWYTKPVADTSNITGVFDIVAV